MFDADAAEADGGTFVTGLGIPGSKTKLPKEDGLYEETKYYEDKESELLDRVDNTEKEMH